MIIIDSTWYYVLVVMLTVMVMYVRSDLANDFYSDRRVQSDVDVSSSTSSSSSSSDWYTRYEYYPEYCSLPSQMEKRKIPPLQNVNGNANHARDMPYIGETRLLHVTAVIRHGSRTPYSAGIECWDGFWTSPLTGKWDCNLTTYLTAPSREPVVASTTTADTTSTAVTPPDPHFVFEKRYDALMFPEEGLTNLLHGTCQVGQLLPQGYEQELFNGRILREAYTYRKGEFDHDERMRLLDLSLQDYLPWHPRHLYFRADDDQRTVMSGQVLLQGLFDTELTDRYVNGDHVVIPLHVADRDADVLDPNEDDCPRLSYIRSAAQASLEFQQFNNSRESQRVRDYVARKLNVTDDASDILDCLMCTICTDRPLHPAVDDYRGDDDGGSDTSWFSRLAEYDIQTYTKVMKYNQSEYARLAMGPLWYEIMQNINPHLIDDDYDDDEDVDAPKFALFSGHDTTIIPLLASIGPELWNDTDWPGYASMMLIEIHELIDGQSDAEVYTSKHAFRLIYNGKILTTLVSGCHEHCELCDIKHLKAKLDPIATRDGDCSLPPQAVQDNPSSSTSQPFWASLHTPAGTAVFVGMVIMSGFLGCLITYYCMLPRRTGGRGGRKAVVNGGEWEVDFANGDQDQHEEEFHDEPR